jgi:hypothetical protein
LNERILVLVRAIPEKSERFGYLICVAGINEKNEWRRLYPFKFIYGKGLVDFGKKDLIDVVLADPDNDKRKESRKVITHENMNSKLNDEEVLQRIIPLVSSIEKLKKEDASLGIIKPELTGIDIIINSTDIYDQQTYFSLADDFLETREKVKMPVELRYKFKCKDEPECKGHTLSIWHLDNYRTLLPRKKKRFYPKTLKCTIQW